MVIHPPFPSTLLHLLIYKQKNVTLKSLMFHSTFYNGNSSNVMF